MGELYLFYVSEIFSHNSLFADGDFWRRRVPRIQERRMAGCSSTLTPHQASSMWNSLTYNGIAFCATPRTVFFFLDKINIPMFVTKVSAAFLRHHQQSIDSTRKTGGFSLKQVQPYVLTMQLYMHTYYTYANWSSVKKKGSRGTSNCHTSFTFYYILWQHMFELVFLDDGKYPVVCYGDLVRTGNTYSPYDCLLSTNRWGPTLVEGPTLHVLPLHNNDGGQWPRTNDRRIIGVS